MKYLDDVNVLNDKDEGITKGMLGTIIEPDIKNNSFNVLFQDQRVFDKDFMNDEDNILKLKKDICTGINIKDLELVRDNNTDEMLILADLPQNRKDWWCKVEDGYILNLKGERKNKIPYDYES